MKHIIPAILISAMVLSFTACSKKAAVAGGFDWPQWRGPDHNGQSRETDWNPAAIASPKVLWTADVGVGYSNVVIQRGRLYAMGLAKGGFTVSCLDAATGRIIWQQPFASVSKAGFPQATPAVDGDSLFILTTVEGYLFCLDSRNGQQKWQKDIVRDYGAVKPFYGFAGSPIVVGDLVVLTANTAGMAVKRDTGELVWTSEKPPQDFKSTDRSTSTGTAYSAPVLYEDGGRRLAIVASWRGVTSVDVRTGEPAWQFGWEMDPGGSIVDPVLAGDLICVAGAWDYSGFLLRMSGTGPRLIWRTADLFCNGAPPVIIEGNIYTMNMGPSGGTLVAPTTLRCLDLGTGRLMWDVPLGPNGQNKCFSLTAANGTLVVLDDQGTLYTAQASPEGFKEIAHCDVLQGASVRLRLFWTPPVLCNAKIYCRNTRGDLVCIDVSK